MRLIKKLFLFFLLLFSFHAKTQIAEARWEIISSPNFDLYLPKSSDVDYYRLLGDVENHLSYCENLFDFHLNESIRLVLSKNVNIVKNPVSLNNSKSTEVEFDRHTGYIVSNNSYNTILLQAKNAIVEILFNDLMYGKSFQDRIQNNALLQVPNWFLKGVMAYCNEPWLNQYDGMLREYFLANRKGSFNVLDEHDETLAGYSFWKFLVNQYGEQNIANVLYISHLSRSIESGMYFVYGKSIPVLMEEWSVYFHETYSGEFKGFSEVPGTSIRNATGMDHISVSPDGKWLAGIKYDAFKTKIYCLNLLTNNRTLINTSDASSEVLLRWRDFGNRNELVYKISSTGIESIVFYNPIKSRNIKTLDVNDFDKLLNFDMDVLGNYVFYGVKKSKSYLLYYSSERKKLVTLLSQVHLLDVKLFDNQVYFAANTGIGNHLIRYNGTFDTLLTMAESSSFRMLTIDSVNLTYFANSTGLNQVYQYHWGTKAMMALTDFTHYSPSISCSAGNEFCFYAKGALGSAKILSVPFRSIDTVDLPSPFCVRYPFGKSIATGQSSKDTLSNIMDDTAMVENPRYYFLNGFNEEDEKEFQYLLDSIKWAQKASKLNLTVSKSYDLNFATLKVSLLQLDNSNFFNIVDLAPLSPTGYQYYNYYNYLKSEMVLKDILNKYQILGGFRLSTNLGGGYDTYLKFEKTFKRYTLQSSVYYFQKRFYLVDDFVLKQQIQSTNITYSYRYSNTVTLKVGSTIMPFGNSILSTERSALSQNRSNATVFSLNTEFQYRMLKRFTDFLYQGINIQVLPQFYYNSSTTNTNAMVKGLLKYYLPVYRKMIWSNQLQINVSVGKDKVANILGGAENWIFARYDEQNQFSNAANYHLRSYAGAIRGFKENARNGNNSFCFNSELRIPLASLLHRWPTDRNWYRNLLVIPFVDVGSAWNGLNLFDESNNYSVRLFDYSTPRYIAKVEVKNLRAPIIGSFGCGINTRIMGYNTRFDLAFGIEDGKVKRPLYLFSYGTNF